MSTAFEHCYFYSVMTATRSHCHTDACFPLKLKDLRGRMRQLCAFQLALINSIVHFTISFDVESMYAHVCLQKIKGAYELN